MADSPSYGIDLALATQLNGRFYFRQNLLSFLGFQSKVKPYKELCLCFPYQPTNSIPKLDDQN
jgi:hypothetical protein